LINVEQYSLSSSIMIGAFFSDVTNLGFVLVLGLVVAAVHTLRPESKPLLETAIAVPPERIQRVLAGVARAARAPRSGFLPPRPVAGDIEPAPIDEDGSAAPDGSGVVARLVPQIPIRSGELARSWFGGGPEMAAAMPWPKFSGRRGLFLAQICCADLPEDLWNGQGPRKGWLAFFVDPQDGRDVRVLHFAERGPARTPPAPGACRTWRGASEGHAFPRWPLDIVAVTSGEQEVGVQDPRIAGRPKMRRELDAAGFDLASPDYHPFDWASAQALTDLALAAIARRRNLIQSTLPDVEKKLANARKQLELGAMTEEMSRAMRLRAQDLPPVVEGWKESLASLNSSAEKLRAIAEELRARAEAECFSLEAIAEVMTRLQAITVTHVERGLDPARGADAETVRIVRLPLTAHDPDVGFFVPDYEAQREDWAKQAYCAEPDALPAVQRAFFERIWSDQAAHEMSGMGHAPFHFVCGFDRDRQTVLIEFVSSELLNWRFGDVASLAVTIDKAALAKGDFSTLLSRIT
jgi:hypothetical protein